MFEGLPFLEGVPVAQNTASAFHANSLNFLLGWLGLFWKAGASSTIKTNLSGISFGIESCLKYSMGTPHQPASRTQFCRRVFGPTTITRQFSACMYALAIIDPEAVFPSPGSWARMPLCHSIINRIASF